MEERGRKGSRRGGIGEEWSNEIDVYNLIKRLCMYAYKGDTKMGEGDGERYRWIDIERAEKEKEDERKTKNYSKPYECPMQPDNSSLRELAFVMQKTCYEPQHIFRKESRRKKNETKKKNNNK